MKKEQIDKMNKNKAIIRLAKSCLFLGRRGYSNIMSDKDCWKDFLSHPDNVKMLNDVLLSQSSQPQNSLQEIEKEAEKYAIGRFANTIWAEESPECLSILHKEASDTFIAGAKWASQQPCPPVGEQGGWISKYERKPEKGQQVLVYNEYVDRITIVHFTDHITEYTHWQPLPKQPTK